MIKPDSCPLCNRPNYFPSDHHLVPRSRGGKTTETLCCDCHNAIHANFTNKQLEKEYSTVEALTANEKFAKMIKYISKQNPQRKQSFKRTKETKNRGRSG